MAMRIKRYGVERIAQYGRSRATLDATVCRHWMSIHHVSPRRTQKAQNGPSTQLIEATSCVKRSNAIKAKEQRKLSSYQTLTTKKK